MLGRGRRALVTLFLLLLAALQISSPQAVVNVVWRAAVVSFDSPATQVLDRSLSRSRRSATA
jgi:hypothetical protein